MTPATGGQCLGQGIRRAVLVLFVLAGLLVVTSDCRGSEGAERSSVVQLPDMVIPVGETRIVPANGVSRAAVGDPSIVDIVVIGPDLILANAKVPGKTSLHLWTDTGVGFVTVTSYRDLSEIIDQAAELIGNEAVSLTPAGSSVVLEGRVESDAERDRVVKIASAYFGDVVDLLVLPDSGSVEDQRVRDGILSLVRYLGVDVRVVRGRALLTGTVTKAAEKEAAETMARLYADEVISLIEIEGAAEAESQSPQLQGGAAGQVGPAENAVRGDLGVAGFAAPEIQEAEVFGSALGEECVAARFFGDTLVMEGRVEDQNALERLDSLASAYWNDTVTVVDLSNPIQVLISVLVVEVDRSDATEAGITFGMRDATGEIDPWTVVLANVVGDIWSPPAGILPAARARATETVSGRRILAAPSLLTLSGEPASFLAGGEIPVYLGRADGRVVFEWREYGVSLKIVPTVNRLGLIHLDIEPEVTELDPDRGLKVDDYVIPAFTTRRVETSVVVRDGQTIAIGGLLSSKVIKVVEKLPILADLPVIGALFRSTEFQRGETELMIFITPEICTVDGPVNAGSLLVPNMEDVPLSLSPEPLQ